MYKKKKALWNYTECDGRTYGLNCIQTCGACINNSYCHHISGMCPWGCDNGFQGMNCNEGILNLFTFIKHIII